MSDLNVVCLSGRLTRAPEVRVTPNGSTVMDLALASNQVWYKDGERQEDTAFVDVSVWGKQAETLQEYLDKGSFILVEGRLKMDRWETSEGLTRTKIRVTASRINLTPKQSAAVGASVSDDEDAPF